MEISNRIPMKDSNRHWHPVSLTDDQYCIPDWLLDVHIDWLPKYNNAPRVTIRVSEEISYWPNQKFIFDNGKVISKSDDGRMIYYLHHSKTLTRKMHKLFVTTDEVPAIYPPKNKPYSLKEITLLSTEKGEGLGGAKIVVQLMCGEYAVIEGPWVGQSPPGYESISYINDKNDYFREGPKNLWYQNTGVLTQLKSNIVASAIKRKYGDDMKFAVVTIVNIHSSTKLSSTISFEPFPNKWGMPKSAIHYRYWNENVSKLMVEADYLETMAMIVGNVEK